MIDKPIQLTPGQVDDLKRQIDTYEKSNNWKLPATLNAVKDASDALVLSAAERKEFTQLRAESISLRDHSQKLAAEIAETKKKLTVAQDELVRISVPVTTIELTQGDSKFLIENTVNLALVNALPSRAYIRLANKERTIELGETIEYETVVNTSASNCCSL